MNGELKDVARATIVAPKNRMHHNTPIPDGFFKVSMIRVFAGCDEVDPPVQPVGAEDHLLLRECIPWPMMWPKTQIRISPDTPHTTPEVGLGQNPVKASAPAPPQLKEPAAREDDIFDDCYIDDDRCEDGGFMDPLDEPSSAPHTHEPSQPDKAACTKRLFDSQETPPADDFTQKEASQAILSPNTLLGTCREALAAGGGIPSKPKKARKRTRKSDYASGSQPAMPPKPQQGAHGSSSQPPMPPKPIRFKDGPGPSKDVMQQIHIAGLPMVPHDVLSLMSGDMQMLHERVLTRELDLLKMKDPTHPPPLFTAKVPEGVHGFCIQEPADLLFLRFDDIFKMFNLRRLHPHLVRLFCISTAHQVQKEKIGGVAIADPYYMIETNFRSHQGWQFMSKHLEEIMVENKWKDYILLPYYPE